MSETRVVHVRDNVEGAVYIGRAIGRARLQGSKWANPIRIDEGCSRDRAIRLYREYLLKSPLLAELPELRGKSLACWCRGDGDVARPRNACHGDVLVAFLNTYTDDELRAMGGGA